MAYGSSQVGPRIGATPAGLHQTRASSVTYITAHGNTRSLTLWARPGMEPMSSGLLLSHDRTSATFFLPLPLPSPFPKENLHFWKVHSLLGWTCLDNFLNPKHPEKFIAPEDRKHLFCCQYPQWPEHFIAIIVKSVLWHTLGVVETIVIRQLYCTANYQNSFFFFAISLGRSRSIWRFPG